MNANGDGKSGKSLWGYGVVAVYTVFALATLAIVAYAMTQKVELVSNDYYARELKYEQQIDRTRNTSELSQQVACGLSSDGKSIQIRFPSRFAAVKGTIMLYRPSESALDVEYEIDPNEQGLQELPTARLAAGFWRVKVTWSSAEREYYNEFLLKV